ncbi:MAG: VOC family protein [Xanthobacteraceae bacterium]
MVAINGRFVWYELVTTEIEAAKAFYSKVMGWTPLDASVPGRAYALFAVGNVLVGGLMGLPEEAREAGAKPNWLGYVGVDDVAAAADRIERLGGTVLVPPTEVPGVSRFSIFADPQNAKLALLKWQGPGLARAAEPDGLGRVGWHELLAADWEKALAFYSELFGWRRANAHSGAMGTYQVFSDGVQPVGGVITKPPDVADPFWLFYFNVGSLDAAAQRVKAGGGQIIDGPFEVPGGTCVLRCADPQGAMFALEGELRRKAVGYFKRVGGGSSDPRGRR